MKTKAIAACGNGMGSSQMIKMKINKVFKRLGIDAEIGHMSVGEAKGVANNYDMIFVSETFTSQFRTGKRRCRCFRRSDQGECGNRRYRRSESRFCTGDRKDWTAVR